MTEKSNIGAQGENLAVAYLENKAYRIIETNWHCRFGEIDIVAQFEETWVFCEVKTQHGINTEQAFANITPSKAQKLLKAAYPYIEAHQLEDALWRIDAIAIALPPKGTAIIEHVEDALDW